ncbi:MAG: diacylglycerol kinase family lipid kinase [Ignavibacteria bacterium]|nr:diacylglycerol kinase family lipid kinase [Ignavibacteria bacterium]
MILLKEFDYSCGTCYFPRIADAIKTIHGRCRVNLKPNRAYIVVNPTSSGGKTAHRQARIVDQITRRLGGNPSLLVTTKPLEATESTRSAIERGAELVIAIGGDGTVHEVVNGFMAHGAPINPSCQLGIVGSGTAQDVLRSFNLPRHTDEQIEVACGDGKRVVDLGRVTVVDPGGNVHEQFFLNECQQGIAAVVVQRFQAHHKWLGGFLGFGLTAVTTAARHREQVMSIEIDGKHVATDSFLGVVVSNGGYAGGGMNFAPRAEVDDGLLDVVLIHKQNIPSRLINFPRIYFGSHINLSWISYFRGRHVSVNSDEKVPVEADGEFLGYLPCIIDVMPHSLLLKSGR